MTGSVIASRPVPTNAAPVGTPETRENTGVPDRPDLSRPGLPKGEAETEDTGGIRHWLGRLPPLAQDMAAEERAAIEAEARGDCGPPKPAPEHAAEVAALVRRWYGDTRRTGYADDCGKSPSPVRVRRRQSVTPPIVDPRQGTAPESRERGLLETRAPGGWRWCGRGYPARPRGWISGQKTATAQKSAVFRGCMGPDWRRGWDSNPRYP